MTNPNAVQVYDKNEVKAYASRLLEAVPGTKALQPGQAQALAEIALAHNLNPYNAEVWYIPGSGVSVGIKGYRKHSRRQLKTEGDKGSNFWTQFERVTNPQEYGEAEDSMVYLCHLRDDVSLKAWGDSVKYFKDEIGLDEKTAVQAAGKAPVYVGIGVLGAKEPTGRMPRTQRAQKRAEAHALKQRFDIQFAFMDDDQTPIDVEFTEITDTIGKSAEQASEELGYPREDVWSDKQIQVVLDNAPYISDKERVISFLDKSGLATAETPIAKVLQKNIKMFAVLFQGQIDSDKSEAEAFQFAKDSA